MPPTGRPEPEPAPELEVAPEPEPEPASEPELDASDAGASDDGARDDTVILPWQPRFDQNDDLHGLLRARGRLLSRAFRGQTAESG